MVEPREAEAQAAIFEGQQPSETEDSHSTEATAGCGKTVCLIAEFGAILPLTVMGVTIYFSRKRGELAAIRDLPRLP